MAEKPAPRPRKPRTPLAAKAAARGKPTDTPTAVLARIERKLDETREQMAFLYGVLEEISQRQTVQAAWQLDWAKSQQRLLEAQSTQEKKEAQGAVSPQVLEEITQAAERLLKRIDKSRGKERIRGLRKAEKTLGRVQPSDEESTVVVLPAKEEIH